MAESGGFNRRCGFSSRVPFTSRLRDPRRRIRSPRRHAHEVGFPLLVRLGPLFSRLGYGRLERPGAAIEARIKGFLFDCRMCGDCVLSKTGMSCPMNCPKAMRNGPCGGVRPNGNCEVYPDMACVWAKAWEGSLKMRGGRAIAEVLPPVNHLRKGSSTWLRLARERAQA